jgi:hypothetical protein
VWGAKLSATAEFRLSITRALGDQLADAMTTLTPIPLTAENVRTLETRGGVYQLYKDHELVYIGKADRSLVDRVGNHRRKISGRLGITLDQMTFTGIYVDEDLSAVAPETLLINRHRGQGRVPWNFNGFGNKDPGRERDTSKVEAAHFDSQYPANLDYICSSIHQGSHIVGNLLAALKTELPYVLRFQDGNKRGAVQPSEYWITAVMVGAGNPTADSLFELLAAAMPGWQITALPGYVIMYRESRRYAASRKVYQRNGGGT